MRAAAKHQSKQDGNHNTDDGTVPAKSVFQREGDGVGLEGIVHQRKGCHQKKGKQFSQLWHVQHVLDIIGGTAVIVPFASGDFVNLGQRAFHKTGGAADNGYHPHPEYGTRPAQHNGDGYAGNVTHAYPAGGTDAKCLERGNLPQFSASCSFH